jgi:hypothetical protein
MFSVGVGGAGGVTAVVELVVVVQAVSTADAQPRENARREMPGARGRRGSDEGEGDDDFKKFSCDAAGTGVGSCSSHSVKPSSNGAHDKT